MRILAGRSYWRPRQRLDKLRRFAFLGDSYVFGQGVSPDETLPARTERHLNEMFGATVIEGVNFGVCGYNAFNAWLSFKRVPQVFDGAILVLCSNDAQLLGRTYNIDYGGQTTELWEPDHAIHEALRSGFDDMAAHSRSTGLPLAVCYYNVYPGQPLGLQKWSKRIAEIIEGLCTTRGLSFIDVASHIAGRNISDSQLVIGEADYHPSALVHDAAARHLALALRERGWLGEAEKTNVAQTPAVVVSTARAMIETDAYPADAALGWASRALESKELATKRRQTSEPVEGFWPAAESASADLAELRSLWHRCMQIAAQFSHAVAIEGGYAANLSLIDEEMLRLEELAMVASLKDERRALAGLLDKVVEDGDPDIAKTIADARTALGAIDGELRAQIACVEDLKARQARSWLGGNADLSRTPSDMEGMTALIAGVRAKIAEYLEFLSSLPLAHGGAGESWFPGLARKSIANAMSSFRAANHVAGLRESRYSDHTTIDATLDVSTIEGRHPCVLEIQVNCTAPVRLPLVLRRNFLPNGARTTLAFRFPAFYAGRAIVSVHIPDAIADRVRADLIDLNVYNFATASRTLPRDVFAQDATRRLVSPPVCLV